VRFLLAGALAALVNFGARVVLSLHFRYGVAIVVAYGMGMATAFVLNRRFVFHGSKTRLRQQISWFVGINLLALLQTLGASILLARLVLPGLGVTWHVEEVAHALGIAAPVATSYFAHRHLTFR
jgi:putative flippase GtrA